MSAGLLGSERPLQEAYDVALVDLDGVAYRGPTAIDSAPPALAAARDAGLRLVFVTNNASREPSTVADHLTELGIPTAPGDVLTAAQAGAALLGQHVAPGSSVMVVGGAGLHTAVESAGYRVVDRPEDGPDAVIQGFSPDLGWRDLAAATYAIQQGAVHIATNLDLTLPTEHGMAPGNGALVRVIATATGAMPPSAGKPEPAMFRLAADRAEAKRPLVIGDRLDTDLKGARAAGYPGLMVLTGVNDAHDAVVAPPEHRPSYIGADLECLAQSHAAPVRDGDGWRVREARATVSSGRLTLTGTPSDPVDLVRAACAAAWAAADAGDPVTVESIPPLGVGSAHG